MKAVNSMLIEIIASCDDCDWECETRNAQGLASQHAEKTGHLVVVTVTRHYEYARWDRWTAPPSDART
jgi:hypothetical protein